MEEKHVKEIVPVIGKERSKLYREVKRDNHEKRLLIKDRVDLGYDLYKFD